MSLIRKIHTGLLILSYSLLSLIVHASYQLIISLCRLSMWDIVVWLMSNNMADEPDFSILRKKEEAEIFSKMLQPTKELHGVTSHNTVISILTATITSNVIYYYFCRVNFHYCLPKQVFEGKIMGEIEVTRRWGRRRKNILDDLKDRRGYSHLKEEALDCTRWRNRFGRGVGPVVRQTTEWMNNENCIYKSSPSVEFPPIIQELYNMMTWTHACNMHNLV